MILFFEEAIHDEDNNLSCRHRSNRLDDDIRQVSATGWSW
jgi:hypothetical protein